jgi:hypothetical protein
MILSPGEARSFLCCPGHRLVAVLMCGLAGPEPAGVWLERSALDA